MGVGPMAGIVIETTHRDYGSPASCIQERQARATHLAEDVSEPRGLGQLVGPEKLFASHVAKRIERHEQIRCEC